MQSIIQTGKPYLFRLSSGLLRASSTGCSLQAGAVAAAAKPLNQPEGQVPPPRPFKRTKEETHTESISNQNH